MDSTLYSTLYEWKPGHPGEKLGELQWTMDSSSIFMRCYCCHKIIEIKRQQRWHIYHSAGGAIPDYCVVCAHCGMHILPEFVGLQPSRGGQSVMRVEEKE